MTARETLTQEELKEILHYDYASGEFWRLKNGRKVGTSSGNNYGRIEINGKKHPTSRLAWLYVYGYWPTQEIDHINRKKWDNRIVNLRDVSHSENMGAIFPPEFQKEKKLRIRI